jgi:ribosomal protein S18 acetylase RimI-like enzyme
MTATQTLEPVPPSQWGEAMRFLAAAGGGGARDNSAVARAVSLKNLADIRGPQGACVWWARRGRRCAGVAMVVTNPGRTGMLFFSPPAAPEVEEEALAGAIAAASAQALQSGLSMVQALPARGGGDARVLERAGFRFLAELVYMSLRLRQPLEEPRQEGLAWREYGRFDEEELAEIVKMTYVDSLDCPALSGVRDVRDVLLSHKSTGEFRPQAWWIVEEASRPAGCILVNDFPGMLASEVVYLGLVPAHRGRGLGRILLRRAAWCAGERGMESLTLAVDMANVYAKRLYESEGFFASDERTVYMMTPRGPREGEGRRE